MENQNIREYPVCLLNRSRSYTYVFRKWLDDPVDGQSTADKVFIVIEYERQSVAMLVARLEAHDLKKEDFLLIDIVNGSAIVLDTWMQEIDHSVDDLYWHAPQAYTNWWLGALSCKPVNFEF